MADARAALDELRGDTTVSVGPLTVDGYLQSWLRDVVKSELAGTTHESYGLAVDTHISSRIGHVPLKKLRPLEVRAWLTKMVEDEVGSRTRSNAFTVLSAALDEAVVLDLIAKNPCSNLSKPSHDPAPINPFTLEEARELLKETEGDRAHGILQLGLTIGMRGGEIFGLFTNKIDWKARLIDIDQQVVCIGGRTSLAKPKTRASIRTVEITPDCRDALRDHLAIMMKEGHAGNPLMFPAPKGGLIGRSTFRTRVWNPLVKRCMFKPRGFHHTRHTYATLALGALVPPTVISKNLGHAKVSTTMDIYSHVLESHKSGATDTVARLFG